MWRFYGLVKASLERKRNELIVLRIVNVDLEANDEFDIRMPQI